MFEVARVLGSCEVNIRHTNPVPTLIWLDSVNKTSVASDDPFTMDNSDDVIKLNSALESVWQLGSWHCNCTDTVPLRLTIDESNTSTKATAGILLDTPDTTVGGGGSKNAKVTQ